ncbi:MAG: hypothetical protein ACYDIC_07285 [Desulfobaccales bacterium]
MPRKTEGQEGPELSKSGAAWPEKLRGEAEEPDQSLNRLDSGEIVDFCEDLGWDTCALRAFGALLESSDLEEFSSSSDSAECLRVGLRKIVEMYVERQERKLNELRLKSINSYDWVIRQARSTYENVKQRAFVSADVALEKVRQDLNRLALVIAECGDEYPQALAIREKMLALQGAIAKKIKEKSRT